MEIELEKESKTIQAESLKKKILTRAELLAIASELVTDLHTRTCRKVFRETQHDRARLAYARAATAAVQAYASILRDSELDEIRARLDTIEGRKSCRSGP